ELSRFCRSFRNISSNNSRVVGIDVLPLSTIQTASAKVVAGITNCELGSQRIVLAFAPSFKLPSRNQIKDSPKYIKI
ncbi:MAG: hypothetical protein ACKN9K_25615, partial [Dolichospermum sp.]